MKTQAHIGDPAAHAVLEALTPANGDGSGDVDMGGGLVGQTSGGLAPPTPPAAPDPQGGRVGAVGVIVPPPQQSDDAENSDYTILYKSNSCKNPRLTPDFVLRALDSQ